MALEDQARDRRKLIDRVSDVISRFAGGPWFAIVHVIWFGGWIGLNALIRPPIDRFPYPFLTFLTSLEAIFLSSFILISQSQFEKVADRRAHLDLQINLLAEAEMTKVLQSLDVIATRIGIEDLLHQIDAHDLAAETDVKTVAEVVSEADKEASG